MVKLDTEGLHHLAKDMFAQLDIDGSGELTLSEFKQIITQLDVGFTLDEIGQLVKELGTYTDGNSLQRVLLHESHIISLFIR